MSGRDFREAFTEYLVECDFDDVAREIRQLLIELMDAFEQESLEGALAEALKAFDRETLRRKVKLFNMRGDFIGSTDVFEPAPFPRFIIHGDKMFARHGIVLSQVGFKEVVDDRVGEYFEMATFILPRST